MLDETNLNIAKANAKARDDVNSLLKKRGFDLKYIINDNSDSFYKIILNIKKNKNQLNKILNNVNGSTIILFQFPWISMSYGFAKKINKVAKKSNSKTIVLIHDISELRIDSKVKKLYHKIISKEFKFIDQFDYIICHNNIMKNILISRGINSDKIYELELFDYLIETKNKVNSNDYKKVIVAGNLNYNKARYLYQIDDLNIENYELELYGPNYSKERINKVNYYGNFNQNELIKKLNHGFGLIWDGNSLDTCSGSYGNYLKLNNPHKFSLYMACGIPVIVWKDSALARFVKNNKIGIVIDSLDELDCFFKNLSKDKYNEYLNNVKKIHKKVISGYYLNEVVDEIDKVISYE